MYSCKKDSLQAVPNLDEAVAQAKSWYETSYPKADYNSNKLTTESNDELTDFSQLIKPDWRHSHKYKSGNKDVIELPIDPRTKFNTALKDRATNRTPYDKNNSRSYFLLFNDGKKYTAYVMTVIADASYLKGDTSKLKNNTFSHNDTDFTGLVLYFTPRGKYVQGYAYKDGLPVIQTAPSIGTKNVQSVTDKTLKPQTVTEICIDWYYQTYQDGVLVSERYLYTTCYTETNSGDGSNGGTTPPAPCGTPPPIQASVTSHLTVNSTINQPRLNFLPPTDPSNPCNPTPTNPDSPNFGEPGTGINRIIDDKNFDSLLNFLENNGYSFSDPTNVEVENNGVTYTGQITYVFDSNNNIIARYFSPDVTTAEFHYGMEYSLELDVPNNPMSIAIFGNTLGQYPSAIITNIGGGTGSVTTPLEAQLFSNSGTPINAPDDPLINLGIGVTNISLTNQLTGLRMIGHTQDRRPTPPQLPEDMTYGTDGNTAGIVLSEVSANDAKLFSDMKHLFADFTALDAGGLGVVGTSMISKFAASTGGQFSDPVLNNRVASSSEYQNFIQKFGAQLNAQLQLHGGDLSKITTLTPSSHPVFNGTYNKFHGLTILIDDTEYTEIKIANYNYINGHWTAILDVTIHDDFGLDKNDATKFQMYNYGFAAWWLLQHKRGYKPFETIVHLQASIAASFIINEQ